MDEIKVESANSTPVPAAKEWFIPLMDWNGDGCCWCAGSPEETAAAAEMQIRNCRPEVKMGRIIRVVLPCKEIP